MRHSKDRSPSMSWLGLLVVLAVTSLAAQQPSSPAPQPPQPQPRATADDQPPPRFRTDANYVRVDAYPTRDGTPIEDLKAEDFELLENGVRQQIQAFERVVISPAGPQSMRVEADSVRGAEQMASNPRNRVFVIFLDMPNVDVESAHHVNQPLVRLVDRILGPDDLIAVMTPEMSAAQITFGRKTEVIAGMLSERWYWGTRNMPQDQTEREREYEQCFSPTEQELKSRTAGFGHRQADDSPAPRAGDPGLAQGPRSLPRLRARGAQGDSDGDPGLGALPSRCVDNPAAGHGSIWQHRTQCLETSRWEWISSGSSAWGPPGTGTATPCHRPFATRTGCIWPASTTRITSGRFWMSRIATTRRSIRSIRGAWPRSTRRWVLSGPRPSTSTSPI